MERPLKKGFLIPSSIINPTRKLMKGILPFDRPPKVGDIVYGEVLSLGQHKTLENKSGRIHNIYEGTKAVFVFGNRYAPDYYEGIIPETNNNEVDLLARSGMIGEVRSKSSKVVGPTKIKVLGYVCDKEGRTLNTKDFPSIKPSITKKKEPRAKLILVCGTSMNSGKSFAAAACCRALSLAGHQVRASKVTGTASLKDILRMNDSGAKHFSDFTYLGYPSTYLIEFSEALDIFNKLDLRYANNPDNYWVVELADGINQRETAYLLSSSEVQKRIHKLIFCAADAFGAIGGMSYLKDKFGLKPDAISGICSSSPLHVREIQEFTDIPIFDSIRPKNGELKEILK